MLGLLLETHFESKRDKRDKSDYSFESFRDACLRSGNNVHSAKQTFYELRHLQKRFEDVFYSIGDGKHFHNKIGSIICLLKDSSQRKSFINRYFNQSSNLPLNYIDLYYKYIFLNIPDSQIDKYVMNINNSESNEELQTIITDMLARLESKNLYNEEKNYALLQLLRLNIEEDTKLNRAFDFSFWYANNKSLEHIFPKSKIYYENDKGKYLRGDGTVIPEAEYDNMKNNKTCICGNNFNEGCSEHCIGNLVLLHKKDNSAFSDKTFDGKKQMYFEFNKPFESRHLLHTVSAFAKNKWGIAEIEENKYKIIKGVKEYYGRKD